MLKEFKKSGSHSGGDASRCIETRWLSGIEKTKENKAKGKWKKEKEKEMRRKI